MLIHKKISLETLRRRWLKWGGKSFPTIECQLVTCCFYSLSSWWKIIKQPIHSSGCSDYQGTYCIRCSIDGYPHFWTAVIYNYSAGVHWRLLSDWRCAPWLEKEMKYCVAFITQMALHWCTRPVKRVDCFQRRFGNRPSFHYNFPTKEAAREKRIISAKLSGRLERISFLTHRFSFAGFTSLIFSFSQLLLLNQDTLEHD